jgi:hypothetical protein
VTGHIQDIAYYWITKGEALPWPTKRKLKSDSRCWNERYRSLRHLKGGAAASANWIERITGSMEAFPEFEEVVRLGREMRHAQLAVDGGTH